MAVDEEKPPRYYRRVLKIRAVDSPNVRYAMEQQRQGITPTDDVIIPGVKTWGDYCKNRIMWDPILQCIGLDAEFWEGAEALLYPPDWLSRAERIHEGLLVRKQPRFARSIGVDPGEGSSSTTMAVGDEFGLIELVSEKTKDTSYIPPAVVAFARKHKVPYEQVFFDRGGGGKQHADNMRSLGYNVKTVAFGESITKELRKTRGRLPFKREIDYSEERYAYVNRRSQMYGHLSILMDPGTGGKVVDHMGAILAPSVSEYQGFGIPGADHGEQYRELRRQMAGIPKVLDREGRLKIPPKNRNTANSNEVTLKDILGCSPDELDAVVLMVYGLVMKIVKTRVGAF